MQRLFRKAPKDVYMQYWSKLQAAPAAWTAANVPRVRAYVDDVVRVARADGRLPPQYRQRLEGRAQAVLQARGLPRAARAASDARAAARLVAAAAAEVAAERGARAAMNREQANLMRRFQALKAGRRRG